MSMIIKKRTLIIATLVVSLAAAIFVNWYYTRPQIKSTSGKVENTTIVSSNVEDEGSLGDAKLVNATANEYFASAKLKRNEAHDEALDALVHVARGDMRRAVNSLQVAASMDKTIDVDTIYQTTGLANPEEVKKMIETALKGNFIAARDKLDEIMIEFGLSGQDIIRQIHSSFFELSIDDREKVMLMDKTGEIEFRIIEGSNERIQLEALLAYLVMVGGTKR